VFNAVADSAFLVLPLNVADPGTWAQHPGAQPCSVGTPRTRPKASQAEQDSGPRCPENSHRHSTSRQNGGKPLHLNSSRRPAPHHAGACLSREHARLQFAREGVSAFFSRRCAGAHSRWLGAAIGCPLIVLSSGHRRRSLALSERMLSHSCFKVGALGCVPRSPGSALPFLHAPDSIGRDTVTN